MEATHTHAQSSIGRYARQKSTKTARRGRDEGPGTWNRKAPKENQSTRCDDHMREKGMNKTQTKREVLGDGSIREAGRGEDRCVDGGAQACGSHKKVQSETKSRRESDQHIVI